MPPCITVSQHGTAATRARAATPPHRLARAAPPQGTLARVPPPVSPPGAGHPRLRRASSSSSPTTPSLLSLSNPVQWHPAFIAEASDMLDVPGRPPPPIVVGDSTCRGVFMEFVNKVAQFEELAKSGERLLVRFRQDLEYFRGPQIPNRSDAMSQIVKSNNSGRMRSYLEAGCRLHCQNISNINQLHSCEDGLKDHINKVKTLLEELECLVEDVYAIKLTTNEDKSADQLDRDVFLVTVMVIVRNMLKLDYTMQENIVGALSLKTLSSDLEGYCLMWICAPYIDDDVMHLAWEICP